MHLEQIAAARKLGVKIRRAVGVATFSGWTTAVFAMLTLFMGFTSLYGFLLGAGMAFVSLFEFRGASEIKRLDRTAPRRLAINQLAFGAMLFAYSGISLWSMVHDPSEITKLLGESGADRETQQMVSDLARTFVFAIYGGVMIAAILGPGLTAVYYYTRLKYIDAYVKQTPQWILDLQRAGMSV